MAPRKMRNDDALFAFPAVLPAPTINAKHKIWFVDALGVIVADNPVSEYVVVELLTDAVAGRISGGQLLEP